MHRLSIVERGTALAKAKQALVLLHGRGASALDIMSLGETLVSRAYYIVAPQATNGTWYPYSFMAPEAQNEPWLSSAVNIVHQLLHNIEQYIPSSDIVVAGFSQGACLTVESVARRTRRYKAIVAFTGGLIGASIDESKYEGSFDGTPFYMSNSQNDPHVPLSRSNESKLILEKRKATVQLSIFENRPHTILTEELNEARTLLR
jgi:phospholipase/carboxylesterase